MTVETRQGIIESVVRKLGVKGTYQGLMCLVYGVDLAYQRQELLMAVTKKLYPAIADHVGGNGKRVERNLRTVTRVCWEFGDRSFLDELAGVHLHEQPTSREMIDYLVHYMRRNHLLED